MLGSNESTWDKKYKKNYLINMLDNHAVYWTELPKYLDKLVF